MSTKEIIVLFQTALWKSLIWQKLLQRGGLILEAENGHSKIFNLTALSSTSSTKPVCYQLRDCNIM